jgi:hypothetical protein
MMMVGFLRIRVGIKVYDVTNKTDIKIDKAFVRGKV